MVSRLARWLGAMVIALGVLGVPEGLGTSAAADTVKLRAKKSKQKSKAGAKKSKKSTRSKKKKKKTKKTAKRESSPVKRPMP